jgi:hypothetical protein
MRFYMETIWISRRADLTPVYAMIFRRLKAVELPGTLDRRAGAGG